MVGFRQRDGGSPRREQVISENTVFVGNLNFNTTDKQLRDAMSEAGRVVDVHIPTDRESGRPRGFAFVKFSEPGEAAAAVERLDGQELAGRPLRVSPAQERKPKPGRSPKPPPGRAADAGDEVDTADDPDRDDDPYGADDSHSDDDDDDRDSRRPGRSRRKPKGSRRGIRGKKRSL